LSFDRQSQYSASYNRLVFTRAIYCDDRCRAAVLYWRNKTSTRMFAKNWKNSKYSWSSQTSRYN